MTSGSDIPEGHAERPPVVEYSEKLIAAKRQDEGGTERLCSPTIELERAVIQLQKDFDDCRTEFEITIKLRSLGEWCQDFLIKSLSDHYNSPGRLAEYKRQFHRVVRRPRVDPSIFAIELETLARRAFIDIDISIQLQMMRDRFIDGQVSVWDRIPPGPT